MATGRLPDPNSAPVTSKGDLYTYSTRADRLAVGNNGDTLVADSSQTTGLRYNPPVGSLANPVINGGMDIWQRGTSFSAGAAAYTADRWRTSTGGPTITVSRQTTSDTTNLPNIQFSTRVQRNSGQTSTATFNFAQSFETVNSLPFAGKSVTFSFYARAGANYSATSSALTANLYSGTGTDQSWIDVAYTGQATVAGGTATLQTTWQRFVFTGTVGATATELAIVFQAAGTGTAGANDWFEVTGVQIDLGTWTASTAPTFRRSGGTLAGELAACQRYYQLLASGNSKFLGMGFYLSATQAECGVHLPVEMRTTPTLSIVTGTNFYAAVSNGGTDGLGSLALGGETTNRVLFLLHGSGDSSGTAGVGLRMQTNNASAFIAAQAEL